MTEYEEKMLGDLFELEKGLTGWEMDFLDDLNDIWLDLDLSEKQHDCLEKIARRVLV